jgi:competence protein ComEC
MQSLLLAKNKKEWLFLISFFVVIFFINISFEYYKYKNLTQEEIYTNTSKIINIYDKTNYKVLKLSNDDFTFFTSTKNNFNKNENIFISIITTNIDFISYLKGFYAKSFNLYENPIKNQNSLFDKVKSYIDSEHKNKNISSLFNALFLAIPLDKDLQNIISSYGISHLIAISGFHLSVLSLMVYFLFNILYKPIHQRYFPYRNKQYDLLLLSSIVLFLYLIFLSSQAPLLRAFVMYIFAIFALRSNIKLLSFTTLLLCILIIISLFPKLLFSLSFWFSICGVFYIFLFLQYFKSLNKIVLFIFLNIWLYLAINPISHMFFANTSLYQLFSPFLTMLFSIFYPLELLLHLVNMGNILDKYIEIFLNHTIEVKNSFTNIYFFIFYLIVSFASIKSKKAFILLNILIILFNIYLYNH